MIDKLKKINERLIETYKDNPQEVQKYTLIKKILNQKDCFLNMSIEQAYAILRDLQISENELKSIYLELI